MLNINNILQHNAPLEIFQAWFEEAKNHEDDPSAFSLATSDEHGRVSNRYLLYKGVQPVMVDSIQQLSLAFVTNFESHKANQIARNKFAAMNFYWKNWHRQVRIEGQSYQLAPKISDELFMARTIESRLASILSAQSTRIDSYDDLLNKYESIAKNPKDHGIDINKRPENWGGYGVVPDRIIFFEYGPHRLNKRVEFRLNESQNWESNWLSP